MTFVKLLRAYKYHFLLCFVVVFGFFLRASHIDWDGGFYLHPDERALYMFTLPISFPSNISEFLSIDSPLNPHFFAYGSFPMYLLKILSSFAGFFYRGYSEYGEIFVVGRLVSSIVDTGTIVLVFLIASKLFDRRTAVVSSFFYSVCVFAIQTSHFFTSDTYMVFFLMLSMYFLLASVNKRRRYRDFFFVGVFFGFSLASKISGVIFVFSIVLMAFYPFLQGLFTSLVAQRFHPSKLKKSFFEGAFCFSLASLVSFALFVVLQPYSVIDHESFLGQLREQQRMTDSAYVFPYTLQYVNKFPYLYEIKNIFLWGLGPFISIFAFSGFFIFFYFLFKKRFSSPLLQGATVITFVVFYFLVVGQFAVGWMRYMLPLYPLLAVFAGFSFVSFVTYLKKVSFLLSKNSLGVRIVIVILIIFVLAWPLSFYQIYLTKHPRILASEWMHKNIPPGSIVATEHWDDILPLYDSHVFAYETLALYERDSVHKWNTINLQLRNTDYLVLSSNRLHGSLRRMRDCSKLEENFCYAETAQYYDDLFSGDTSFRLVAEFHSFPTIPFTTFEINDQSADESFTVYDHPQVFIFKNTDKARRFSL